VIDSKEAPVDEEERTPTAHEISVLNAVIECGTVKKAAERLILSRRTVEAHINHLRKKSNHHPIIQIVVWAIKNGWLNDDDINLE
jgi:DNA-binding NarL/FixJ family response regulator